jgi:predicted transposase YdaD
MKDSPHDKLFKEAFGNPYNAAAEIRCVAPRDLVALMDFASLTSVPGSFRDVALAGSSSDLLFSMRIAGRNTLVYVLFEHKSSTDRWVSFQLLRYTVRIWERCRHEDPKLERLPPIVPLVVHHNDAGWTGGYSFREVVDPVVNELPELGRLTPRFEFLLDDIGRATDEQIRGRALNAFGLLALLFLRDARTPGRFVSAFAHWADLLRELLRAPDGRRALMVLFRYLSIVLDESAWPGFQRVVHTVLPETEEQLMSMAEKWLQAGRQEGMQQGQRTLLVEQLQTKFGSLDVQVLRRLDAADELALKRYAQRVLTAATLDEVFAADA